jgi:dTDP-glucose 4,6-dehydratase
MTHPLTEDLDHILRHTRECWEQLRGARLFLTGGTGFFGTWLLESLAWANQVLDLGIRALVLTRDAAGFARRLPHLGGLPFFDWHEGDVRTFAFPPGSFTHVIHAATPSGTPPDQVDPEEMLDVIIQGTRHTLAFAREAGVRRVLFTSSGAVYGKQPPDLPNVPEEYAGAPDHLNPRFAYHEGKRVAELLCVAAGRGSPMQVSIARCFAFVGPHLPLDAHFAAGNFLRDGLRGGPIRVGGDGSPYRSYLYAADLVIWLWTILVRGQHGRPYNVGSEEAVSIGELAHKVAALCGAEVQIAQARRPGLVPDRYVPSTRRAREELGLQTWVGLDESLARTLRWHRA